MGTTDKTSVFTVTSTVGILTKATTTATAAGSEKIEETEVEETVVSSTQKTTNLNSLVHNSRKLATKLFRKHVLVLRYFGG